MNAETINAAIDASAVLDHFGIDHDGHSEVRIIECPVCRHSAKRGTVSVNLDTGLGRCFKCRDTFNALGLVARLEGLDPDRDRHRVLELAAEIAGIVDTNDPEVQRKIAERRIVVEERRRVAAVERAAARAAFAAEWEACSVKSLSGSLSGADYLRKRGLDPNGLAHVVRYMRGTAPTLPLRDLKTGDVVGLQSRNITEHGAKVLTAKYSQAKGSALSGRVSDLDPDGADVAILVEGLTDTLAAHLAFPGCAIYGAPGYEHMGTIASAIAPRVRECRGWLVIVPDDDEQGAEGAAEAMIAARDAGLAIAPPDAGLDGASSVRLVDLGPHHDLAAAWQSGVRWIWPGRRACAGSGQAGGPHE